MQIAVDTLGAMFGINKTFSIVKQKTREKKLQIKLSKKDTAKVEMATPAPDCQPTQAPGAEFATKDGNPFANKHFVGLHGLQAAQAETENTVNQIAEVLDEKCYMSLRRIESLLRATKQSLDDMSDKADDRDKKLKFKDEKAFEWRVVAVAIDRLFFFIYLAIIIVLAVVSSAILFPRAL